MSARKLHGNTMMKAMESGYQNPNLEYLTLLETCKLKFRTLKDLSLVLEFTKDLFPGNSNILTGVRAIGLNAIEHGNLDIGYQYKAELLAEKRWEEEVKMRLEIPEFANKFAEALFTKKDGGTYIIITDKGNGFDWQKYFDIDPGRAGLGHGRGIAIAKSLAFDKLSYNQEGNQAIGFVEDKKGLDW